MKKGKLIPNGVILEKHECETVVFFTDLGKIVELIPPSNTPHNKSGDFLMDGVIWEAKRPVVKKRRSLERVFYEASCQSCNVVIDLRGLRGDGTEAEMILKKCFSSTRKVRRMLLIARRGELLEYRK